MTHSVPLMEILVSDTDFPPLTKVEGIVREMEKPGASKTDNKWEELDKLCVVQNPDHSFFSKKVLKAIDENAKTAFKECEATIGVPDDKYRNSLKTYARLVNATLEEHRGNHPLSGKAQAKLWWMLARRTQKTTAYPIITNAVLQMLNNSFKEVGSALFEVSKAP